ncbi:hypothetical protein WJX73_001326 [Symbiochloris irregularis]|uniref:Uncharacterized protein n=1 Tax=Symbiochloris irregularis TaxID=706552 RepID=A0AAW1NRF6_9CHLO
MLHNANIPFWPAVSLFGPHAARADSDLGPLPLQVAVHPNRVFAGSKGQTQQRTLDLVLRSLQQKLACAFGLRLAAVEDPLASGEDQEVWYTPPHTPPHTSMAPTAETISAVARGLSSQDPQLMSFTAELGAKVYERAEGWERMDLCPAYAAVLRDKPDWRMRIFWAAYEHATQYDCHYEGFLWRVLVLCALIQSTDTAFDILKGKQEQVDLSKSQEEHAALASKGDAMHLLILRAMDQASSQLVMKQPDAALKIALKLAEQHQAQCIDSDNMLLSTLPSLDRPGQMKLKFQTGDMMPTPASSFAAKLGPQLSRNSTFKAVLEKAGQDLLQTSLTHMALTGQLLAANMHYLRMPQYLAQHNDLVAVYVHKAKWLEIYRMNVKVLSYKIDCRLTDTNMKQCNLEKDGKGYRPEVKTKLHNCKGIICDNYNPVTLPTTPAETLVEEALHKRGIQGGRYGAVTPGRLARSNTSTQSGFRSLPLPIIAAGLAMWFEGTKYIMLG